MVMTTVTSIVVDFTLPVCLESLRHLELTWLIIVLTVSPRTLITTISTMESTSSMWATVLILS